VTAVENIRQTSEGGQEMKPRSEIGARELMREVGAVLRLSEAEAAQLSCRSTPTKTRR
jgi:NADH-quinone oxidoreductase subunit D